MSCKWNIVCLDDGEEHGLLEANHMELLAWKISQNAPAFAALLPLTDVVRLVATGEGGWGDYGTLSSKWFAKHATHRLWPQNEYGELLGDCPNYATCASCRSSHKRCAQRAGHEGGCTLTRDVEETASRRGPE